MMPRVTDTARRIVVLVKDFSDYQLRPNKKKNNKPCDKFGVGPSSDHCAPTKDHGS